MAWKLVPPTGKEPKTKKVGKKTYHWCKTHKAWTIHTEADCKGIDYKGSPTSKKTPEEKKQDQDRLKLAKALATIQEMNDENDE
jgi:hypothetical protein